MQAEVHVVTDVALLAKLVAKEIMADIAPPDPLPALLNSDELARQLSCSTVHVRKLTAEGMPHLLLGDAKRYELERVLDWLRGAK